MKKKAKNYGTEAPSMDRDWRTEDDLRTMQRACEIRKDKMRYARVRRMAKEKLAELKKISSGEAT